MGFFNAPIAAALMLLSVVVFSSASSIAQVPSSSPSPSPSMSREEEKALDRQYLIAKMNETINKVEVFMSKDLEEWRNDRSSNKTCLEYCNRMLGTALDGMRWVMPRLPSGNMASASICMSGTNTVISACNNCFVVDEASQYSTSVGNINSWAISFGNECLDISSKYYPY